MLVALVDNTGLLVYMTYMFGFLCLPTLAVIEYNLPPISTVVVVIEQVSL